MKPTRLFPRLALASLAVAACAKYSGAPLQPLPILAEPVAAEAAAHGERGQALVLQHYGVNPTVETRAERFSTFAADVDTGSYTLARASLARGQLPEEAAVRVEEFVNALDYGYRAPERGAFGVTVEAFPSPNRSGYQVVHVGVKAREVATQHRQPSHLVFTIDVSGSMAQDDRLGLVKRALGLLVEALDERDAVSVVTYGTGARLVLPPTSASDKARILAAIEALQPEGSTNVQAGLELAYEVALRRLVPQGINRVVLCSDGVANTGLTEADALWQRVRGRASEGITLSTVGFGMGHYNDVLMERLADQGDGSYAYVDRLEEARRVFVENLTGTLQVVAKDVKLQLEWNPEAVARYRLLGFENRRLERRGFADDGVDGGELGAGHAVTALYEVKLTERPAATLGVFRARFKAPEGGASRLVEQALPTSVVRGSLAEASGAARLALVAAGLAEKLRGSYWARNLTWAQLLALWDGLPGELKARPQVLELKRLVTTAQRLDTRPDRFEKAAPVASMSFDRLPVLEE